MRQAMVIWNPAAGRINVEKEIREAARVLEEAGWKISLAESQSARHVTELAQQAAKAQLEAVFVAGGDGTLGRAVFGLAGSTTALGVLPTGTTNVWAQEVGLPMKGGRVVVESARRLSAGICVSVDVGLCNGKPFLLWAGLGLDARVIDQLERRRSRFMKQVNELYYALTILRCASGWQGTRMQVTTDEQTVEGQFMLALAGNIQRYAGGLAILSPNAVWDDGRMELWLLNSRKKGGVWAVLRHLWNLGWGLHVKDRDTICLPFRQAQITFQTEEWMHLDGEPYGTVQAVEVAVWAQGLQVILPGGVEREK